MNYYKLGSCSEESKTSLINHIIKESDQGQLSRKTFRTRASFTYLMKNEQSFTRGRRVGRVGKAF